MLISQTLHCAVCENEFEDIVQFNSYRCEHCGKHICICPNCINSAPHCPSCGGNIISNDAYIRKYGITDISGKHYNINGNLLY